MRVLFGRWGQDAVISLEEQGGYSEDRGFCATEVGYNDVGVVVFVDL